MKSWALKEASKFQFNAEKNISDVSLIDILHAAA